jgi:hypothetical protein
MAVTVPTITAITPVVAAKFATIVTAFIAVSITISLAIAATVTVVTLAVGRRIFVAVPIIPDEIHRATAGIVAAAIASPMLGVPRWYAQVKRRVGYRRRANDHRFGEKQRRCRETANIEASVEARLADADGDLGESRGATEEKEKCGCNKLL